ncbi:MAG: hypothetical protein ACPG4X_16950 [Pikeienuella sp.]
MSDQVFFAQDADGYLRRWYPPAEMRVIQPKLAVDMGIREFARAAGVSVTVASRIKKGEGGTNLANLRKVLPFLSECPCCGSKQEAETDE